MAILLRRTGDLSQADQADCWCTVMDAPAPPLSLPVMQNAASRLEAAFDEIRDTWWALSRVLGQTPSAEWAHMPTSGTYASDFGVALAWTALVRHLAMEDNTVLVVCDDPWLFRRLMQIDGVEAGLPPPLLAAELKLRVRGFLARSKVSWRVFKATLRGRHLKRYTRGESFIITYGHPDSRTDGFDAYFGNMMKEFPKLQRMMHADCETNRALRLSEDGRTSFISSWGRLSWIPKLFFTRWQPTDEQLNGTEGWLIRRAAVIEGGGGAAAMTRWQILAHTDWLQKTVPHSIVWPWENHPWEREIVRLAKRLGIRTIGFQHTVIGPHMFGQSPSSNRDGLESIPEMIICNGPAYRDQLVTWGIPEKRLSIGGNLRLAGPANLRYDPDGPVFVALPGHLQFASQLMASVYGMQDIGRSFLFKVHPMYEFAFKETENIKRTRVPLNELPGLSAVVYCLGTVGLEFLLSGIPTYRFRPSGSIAMDILPPSLSAIAVDSDSLNGALEDIKRPDTPPAHEILSDIKMENWEKAFNMAANHHPR